MVPKVTESDTVGWRQYVSILKSGPGQAWGQQDEYVLGFT
jgi:hypothetical protein